MLRTLRSVVGNWPYGGLMTVGSTFSITDAFIGVFASLMVRTTVKN
jgi:hypothetical protein